MSFSVNVPGPLRDLTGGRPLVAVEGTPGDVAQALTLLFDAYPGLRDRVVDETGQVRTHVNVFVGEESIRHLDGLKTRIEGGAELFILPALSGG